MVLRAVELCNLRKSWKEESQALVRVKRVASPSLDDRFHFQRAHPVHASKLR